MVQQEGLVASTQLVAMETEGRVRGHLHPPQDQRLGGKVGDVEAWPEPAWL